MPKGTDENCVNQGNVFFLWKYSEKNGGFFHSHITVALQLPLFQTFLTERVTGNVRVLLTEMESN